MRRKAALGLLLFELCLAIAVVADEKPPVFVFGGKELYVGMPKRDALAALAACCKLQLALRPFGRAYVLGFQVEEQTIVTRESPQRILGGIGFSNGKVVYVTRPLAEDVDSSNDDAVGFARALSRSLSRDLGDSETTVRVSVQHDRFTNAEMDTVSLSFPNGRRISLHLVTTDKPDEVSKKRDSAELGEILESPRPE